ncbi:MAG: aspartate-semialdehyde dehydrogenase [Oligoflexia bacterium]|nr:aspartate-semialdehyde dehydrogenase [Oligoflexia bacterium]
MIIAVVGAAGIVGQEFIQILESKDNFKVKELRLFGSTQSVGETLSFKGKSISIKPLSQDAFKGCQIAFFSAGNEASKAWAPKAVKEGCFVIDNSSQFRMDKDVSLIVPEVNIHMMPKKTSPQIIANPNCAAIQLTVVLNPLQRAFGLKQVIASTYQSVSGAGKGGIEELSKQTIGLLNGDDSTPSKVFAHSIAFNNLPHIDKFDDNGFTMEELKIMEETKKILSQKDLDISVTAVRTPTFNGHSEAVWVEFKKHATRKEVLEVLSNAPGVVVQDNPSDNIYPLNRNASGQDEVFVGRIRQDLGNKNRWVMWIVSDNVRKGAALNGIQIAEKLFDI